MGNVRNVMLHANADTTFFCSFEKVNKKSLISYQTYEHNMLSKKIKMNYIGFIYHLKGGVNVKCNVHYIWGDHICFIGLSLWLSNSLLRLYNQFGNFTLSFALF